jgi:RimJ/RimL family protein N-acetyltransferase
MIELRELRVEDAKRLTLIIKDKDVLYNMDAPFTVEDITVEFEKKFLEKTIEEIKEKKKFSFGIYTNEELIGVIGTTRIEEERAEFGYWIGKAYWNKGYVTKATELFVPKFVESFPDKKLESIAFSINPASQRVLEKNGFVKFKEEKKKHTVSEEEIINLYYELKRD